MYKIKIKKEKAKDEWKNILHSVQEDVVPKHMYVDDVKGEVEITFEDEPEQKVKNKIKDFEDK